MTATTARPSNTRGPRVRAPRGTRLRLPAVWRTPLAIVGAVIALAWIVVAFTAPLWVPYPPDAQALPRLLPPGTDGALLGTDALGRDLFSRLMSGAGVTIPLSLMLVAASVVIGTVIGACAGYFGKWVDEVLMRITDLFMAFPTVILAMVVAASLGPSLFNAVIAAIVVSWPQYARVTRSLVLGLRGQNYVIAGRLLGHSPLRSLLADIAPNITGPVVVLAALDIGSAILLLSGLSFLGLGAQPPTAEWGSMISSALQNFDAWWIGLFPGLAILTVVMAFNFIGDSLRDALDPSSRTERAASGVAAAPKTEDEALEGTGASA